MSLGKAINLFGFIIKSTQPGKEKKMRFLVTKKQAYSFISLSFLKYPRLIISVHFVASYFSLVVEGRGNL